MFTTAEFARAAGISFRQADYWIRQGIIFPIGAGMPGSGARREWATSEIRVARVIDALISPIGGRTMNDWPLVAAQIRAIPAELWDGIVFVNAAAGTVSNHATHGAIVIDLGIVDEATRRAVDAIYEDRSRSTRQYAGAL